MKLDYKILWFEDDSSYFDSIVGFVQELIEGLGFNFVKPVNEINSDNLSKLDFPEFDLIIVDLNLSNNEKGTKLLEKIRSNEVFTEVVFYSSNGEKAVREALKEFEIDGVYCSGRDTDDFMYKIDKVIQTTTRKVQDVNNMRGLIMAGTSDLDGIMKDIIEIIINERSDDIRQKLIDQIFNQVKISINEKLKKFETWSKDTSKHIMKLMSDTMMFDASKKINAIQLLFDLVESDIIKHYKNEKFLEEYSKEITEYRNIFAHVTVVEEGGKKVLKSKSKEIVFTHELCQDIRKNLKKYNGVLNEFHGHLSKKQ